MSTDGRGTARAGLLRLAPLAVLGAGAAATFLASIYARKILSEAQFVEWAYLTSILAIFFSFSLLGSEQLIIRTASFAGDQLRLPRAAVTALVSASIIFAVAWIFFLDGWILQYRLGLGSITLVVGVGLVQVSYQLLRTRGVLFEAQVVANLWRLLLIPALVVAVSLGAAAPAKFAVALALSAGATPALIAIVRNSRRIRFDQGSSDVGSIVLPFALSLGTLALLNAIDRLLVERLGSPETFADYVYSVTILVTPFGVLANYLGFKEAVRYRKEYSRHLVFSDAVRAGIVSIALVAAWLLLAYMARGVLDLSYDLQVWVALGILAVLRNIYSIGSAAMGVKGSPRAIYSANALTLVGIFALVAASAALDLTLVLVLVGYIAVWALRVSSYLLGLPD